MRSQYKILIYQPQAASPTATHLAQAFDHVVARNEDDCLALLCGQEFKVLVLDLIEEGAFDLVDLEQFLQDEAVKSTPAIVLSPTEELRYKLRALELGCDDVLYKDDSVEEVIARVNKSIYNAIANEQLLNRLQVANDTAFTAMSDNSDLGSNVQFLVNVNTCNNIDELGQLLFSTLERYDLSCSLQMRSAYGVKNMEANGMAKDLESQLLEQLADAGRYIDFGKRTVMNYGVSSLLVRNMPLDNPKRYGCIKDNLQSLLMGVDARVRALDAEQKLRDEKDALHKLSQDVRHVMTQVEQSYLRVMRDIAGVVEDLADTVNARIPSLALSEPQERFFDSALTQCITETSNIFNRGLKVDDVFSTLCQNVDAALLDFANVGANLDEAQLLANAAVAHNAQSSIGGGKGVELF